MVHFSVSHFPVIGFSGSRNKVSKIAARYIHTLAGSFLGSVLVGCAAGVDLTVRLAFPTALVFQSASYQPHHLVKRSTKLVQSLKSSGGILVAFPSVGCPSGVLPSKVFSGKGSGTWGTIALAVGLGVPVLVYAPMAPVLPGLLQVAGSPGWYSFCPVQLSLF